MKEVLCYGVVGENWISMMHGWSFWEDDEGATQILGWWSFPLTTGYIHCELEDEEADLPTHFASQFLGSIAGEMGHFMGNSSKSWKKLSWHKEYLVVGWFGGAELVFSKSVKEFPETGDQMKEIIWKRRRKWKKICFGKTCNCQIIPSKGRGSGTFWGIESGWRRLSSDQRKYHCKSQPTFDEGELKIQSYLSWQEVEWLLLPWML